MAETGMPGVSQSDRGLSGVATPPGKAGMPMWMPRDLSHCQFDWATPTSRAAS